jgi:hypothetical protein
VVLDWNGHVQKPTIEAFLLLMVICLGTSQNVSGVQIGSGLTRHPLIVFIKPVFTAAAYNGFQENKSFYGFYKKYSHVSQNMIVKSDLDLLNTSVNWNDWGRSSGIGEFLRSKAAEDTDLFKNVTVLTDVDVDAGKLFYATNGARRFDVAVLGFSEYVT